MSTILKLAIKGSEVPPVPGIKDDILAALSAPPSDNPARFAEDLAEAIAQRVSVAVQNYLVSYVQVAVAPGITVATAGSPAAQTGATTSPGIGRLIVTDPPAQPNP